MENFGHISEITSEEFHRASVVNRRGQLLVAQQTYKHLTVRGRLGMLSSIGASAKGVANHMIHSAARTLLRLLRGVLLLVSQLISPPAP